MLPADNLCRQDEPHKLRVPSILKLLFPFSEADCKAKPQVERGNFHSRYKTRWIFLCGMILLPSLLVTAADGGRRSDTPAPTQEQTEFFEKKVRPLLVANCYACHSASNKA